MKGINNVTVVTCTPKNRATDRLRGTGKDSNRRAEGNGKGQSNRQVDENGKTNRATDRLRERENGQSNRQVDGKGQSNRQAPFCCFILE